MLAAKIRKILYYLATAAGMAFLALILYTFVFFVLLEQGWLHPIKSVQIKAEMSSYLEKNYTDQNLKVTFPSYNFHSETFSSYIKDREGNILFGLTYEEDSGITEQKAAQSRHGIWYLYD